MRERGCFYNRKNTIFSKANTSNIVGIIKAYTTKVEAVHKKRISVMNDTLYNLQDAKLCICL